MRFSHVIQAVYCQPWAIRRADWYPVHSIVAVHLGSDMSKLAPFQARIDALPKSERPKEGFFGDAIEGMRVENGVAVIPVKGTMIKGAGLLEKTCGVVSHEDIAADLDSARKLGVRGIVLDVNSPGGTVQGTPELAEKVSAIVDSGLDVYAFTDELMASAAYYISAGASAIFATKSAIVGSIGVIWETYNVAEQLAMEGVHVDVFTSGPFKGMGHPAKPLTPEQAEWMQGEVDRLASDFHAHVQTRRANVGMEAMQGQTFDGVPAVRAGLVNGIVTGIADVLAQFN